jgi:hypothetical protein
MDDDAIQAEKVRAETRRYHECMIAYWQEAHPAQVKRRFQAILGRNNMGPASWSAGAP